jgi:hypothetical protein
MTSAKAASRIWSDGYEKGVEDALAVLRRRRANAKALGADTHVDWCDMAIGGVAELLTRPHPKRPES